MNLPHKVRSHYEAVGGIPELDGRYTVFGQVIEGCLWYARLLVKKQTIMMRR